MSEESDPNSPVESKPSVGSNRNDAAIQFRLSTVFVLTLVACILAAFLSPRGNDLMLAGLVTVTASLIFALAVGSMRPPLVDRVFWGVVVAAMMEAVCAEVILLDRSGIYAWPIVAGFAAVVGAGRSHLYWRMLFSAVVAGSMIAAYIFSLGATTAVMIAYIVCAASGGALLTVLIDFVRWTEEQLRIPQPAIGLALVLVSIGFSVVAPKIIPGW